MSAVRIVMVLWGGLFLVLGPLLPPGDGDLWWQRWLGDLILRTHHLPSALGPETFTSAGVPWVPQEWLLSIVVALAMDRELLAEVASRLERRMKFDLAVTDGTLYLTIGGDALSGTVERFALTLGE